MAGPSVSVILAELRSRGALSEAEYVRLSANQAFFERSVGQRRADYTGRWVAAVNGAIRDAPTYRQVLTAIADLPESRFAYIEQIP